MINVLHFLHFAPLIAVGLIFAGCFVSKMGIVSKKITLSSYSLTILILCVMGMIAGNVAHDHAALLFDPCFGYIGAVALVVGNLVARAVISRSSSIHRNK